jgi:peptide/nickel transport system permease protein
VTRRRLLTLVPTLLGVVTLVFAFLHLVPGDPVDVMLGETALAADKAALRAELGLDRPILEQYGTYLAGIVQGDLGRSFSYREPVAEVIAGRLPATLELAGCALMVAVCVAFPLGVLAAVRRDTGLDRGSLVASLLGVSMPNFWLGPLLILLFSVHLRWLPVSGREGWASVVLPAITLGTGLAAILSRMLRSSLVEVLGSEYLAAARARGVGEGRVIWVHALRNACLPVITLLGLQLGSLLSGAVITEAVFAWPGIGTLLLQALQGRDYPLAQGCVLVISLGYVAANLTADLLYRLADPRVRTGR